VKQNTDILGRNRFIANFKAKGKHFSWGSAKLKHTSYNDTAWHLWFAFFPCTASFHFSCRFR